MHINLFRLEVETRKPSVKLCNGDGLRIPINKPMIVVSVWKKGAYDTTQTMPTFLKACIYICTVNDIGNDTRCYRVAFTTKCGWY